jgi:hypothetical protein
MANWGYLRYRKLSPNTRKVFKHIRRICGKNLFVHGEDEKRLLAYILCNVQQMTFVFLSTLSFDLFLTPLQTSYSLEAYNYMYTV